MSTSDATETRGVYSGVYKRLVNTLSCSHVVVMRHWTARRITVCMLGLILSLGMGLSAVQANSMTVEMALAGDADVSNDGGCMGCGDDTASSGSCYSMCASSVFSMPPSTMLPSRIESKASFLPDTRSLRSTNISPDPHPPRSTFLL